MAPGQRSQDEPYGFSLSAAPVSLTAAGETETSLGEATTRTDATARADGDILTGEQALPA
jgi:hypothetical protein